MKDENCIVEIALKPSRIGSYAKACLERSYPISLQKWLQPKVDIFSD